VVVLPGEPAADRAAQLELVAGPGDACQVRGDLAVIDALDGELEVISRRGTRDRVGALRGVAVLGGELDGDVLSRLVAWPARDVEGERAGGRGLVLDFPDGRDQPGQ